MNKFTFSNLKNKIYIQKQTNEIFISKLNKNQCEQIAKELTDINIPNYILTNDNLYFIYIDEINNNEISQIKTICNKYEIKHEFINLNK